MTGKVVTLPKETTGGMTQYTHYVGLGTSATPTQPGASAGSRYTYPAYGDVTLPPVRKQSR